MKTPDEFLHHHYIHDNGLENTPEYIFNAMKSFADQEKQALKEKIKAIRNRTFWDGEMNVSENGDFVRACNEILKLFNAETLK